MKKTFKIILLLIVVLFTSCKNGVNDNTNEKKSVGVVYTIDETNFIPISDSLLNELGVTKLSVDDVITRIKNEDTIKIK